MIPPRTIQTGKTRSLIRLEAAARSNLTLLHPAWEHLYFGDEEVERFITDEFGEYREVYNGFRYPVQRYDFFRYLAIYKLGGFYFDLDVFLSKPLDDLLSFDCVFPFEELTVNQFLRSKCGMDWELGNYAFGAAAQNPFIGAIIKNCIEGQRDRKWLRSITKGAPFFLREDSYVLNSTGPGMVSRTYSENPALAANIKVLFPDDVRDSASWHLFGDYGVHLMAASWRKGKSSLRRRLGNRWEALCRARAQSSSQRLGPSRSSPGLYSLSAP